jgi:anti-anti-sigma factor
MWQVWLSLSENGMHLDLAGCLDHDTAADVEAVIDNDIRAGRGWRVHLGLAAVDRVDEAGLQMLRRNRVRAQMRGIDLRVEQLSPQVRQAVRNVTG